MPAMQLPIHLLAGWCTANLLPGLTPRQRGFCIIAAGIPDLDGASILFGQEAFWNWHHKVCHNLPFCLLVSSILAAYSPWRIGSFVLYAIEFHLHLAMDVFGSGPHWGIYYFWPFSDWCGDSTRFSWAFYSWQNLTIAGALLVWTILIAFVDRRTPLEAIMPNLDRQLLAMLPRRRTEQ
jgi:hypothetical protein